jgi:hypothetical protein
VVGRADSAGRTWLERAARMGFAARGLVYILVGVLTAGAAAGLGGRATDPQGAIRAAGADAFGAVFLLALALGLAGYAAWRLAEALFDLEGVGRDLRGLVARVSAAASGAAHAVLAFTAARVAAGLPQSRSGNAVRLWTRRVMAAPAGRWIVGAIAVFVIGVAVAQFYGAWTGRFAEHLRLHDLSARGRRWALRIGRAGLSARGVTFAIMGWFLLRAARRVDPHEARGLAGSLRSLAHHEDGPWLLGLVAAGLTAYGLFSIVEARYRSIPGNAGTTEDEGPAALQAEVGPS